MKTLRNNIKVSKVCFTARASANIEYCIRECIEFAAKNDVDVALQHNGVLLEISITGFVRKIYKTWDDKMNKKV